MQAGPTSLTAQLQAFHTGFLERLCPEDRQVVCDADAGLARAGRGARVIEAGDAAPGFTLPDQHGVPVSLHDQLRQGAVVLLFIRGGWCPFCSLTLRAFQTALPALQAAGARLLAICPQPSDRCSVMAERDLLAFPTLSDSDNAVADRFGVTHDISPAMRPLYLRLGHDVPRINRTGNWRVPRPSTFVVRPDGLVVRADLGSMLRRLEPGEVLETLAELRVSA